MKATKNLGAGSLWGELPARETLKQEVITPDIIENVWRQVMEESNNMDCDFQMERQPDYIQLPMGNLHVLNTINFHQQLRMMEEGMVLGNMTTIETQGSQDLTDTENSFNFLPVQKESSGDNTKSENNRIFMGQLHHVRVNLGSKQKLRCNQEEIPYMFTKFQNILNFRVRDVSLSAFKDSSTVHYLTPQTARSILRHSVIVLLAHIGFEKSSDIAIETLTDIADHFLRRMTLLMKVAYEQKDHGFPDIVERVLLETGVGGVAALHDYYQEYVLKLEENMRKKVEIMLEKQRVVLDEAANKLQFEDLDEFGNVYREVPTLQLLDPELGFPPSLDAGFQMLYSLEQDELNSLDVEEEEVNVSDSPSTGQRADTSTDKKKS